MVKGVLFTKIKQFQKKHHTELLKKFFPDCPTLDFFFFPPEWVANTFFFLPLLYLPSKTPVLSLECPRGLLIHIRHLFTSPDLTFRLSFRCIPELSRTRRMKRSLICSYIHHDYTFILGNTVLSSTTHKKIPSQI